MFGDKTANYTNIAIEFPMHVVCESSVERKWSDKWSQNYMCQRRLNCCFTNIWLNDKFEPVQDITTVCTTKCVCMPCSNLYNYQQVFHALCVGGLVEPVCKWEWLDLTTGFNPDSKVHGANMGPTWVLPAPDGPHVGPMNLAIRERTKEPFTGSKLL